MGESKILNKFANESKYVNGVKIVGYCSSDDSLLSDELKALPLRTTELEMLLDSVDAVYIISHPSKHYSQIKLALERGKHVLCESPIALTFQQYEELKALAQKNQCVLMDAIKTAYSTAYYRMLLLAKSGVIGDVVSVDAVCTSLSDLEAKKDSSDWTNTWNSICAWGPTAMLPIFQLLGSNYTDKVITAKMDKQHPDFDLFTKVSFIYPHAVASLKVGQGVKSEGELVISGTNGYIYVPAPWWKTEYFEVRHENPADNKRYFYQLDGEGIRYEIVSFLRATNEGQKYLYISEEDTSAIIKLIEEFNSNRISI